VPLNFASEIKRTSTFSLAPAKHEETDGRFYRMTRTGTAHIHVLILSFLS
jgi:hypothetical protein